MRLALILAVLLLSACTTTPSAVPANTPTPKAAAQQPVATTAPTPKPTQAPPSPTATSAPPTATTVPPSPTPAVALVPVVDVVDGDTIKVEIGGKTESVRIIGIDTPETVSTQDPVQCFGPQASAKAKELLAGKRVRLVEDPTQGDGGLFARMVRYVELADGTDYGLWMIRNGYAHEYTYRKAYQRQVQYKAAYREAREKGAGFWAANTCNGDTTQPADKPVPAATSPRPAPAAPVATATPKSPAPAATKAPQPTSTAAPTRTVRAGAFCSPEGATGVTSTGKPMVCRTSDTDSRLRWRSP